jgi:dephospho-CoA kinase
MRKVAADKRPIVIGLTGSIGAGKSTAAKILKSFGAHVFNADKIAHDLMKQDCKAAALVIKHFPEAIRRGTLDRRLLGRIVFQDPRRLSRLEKIIHPLVAREERLFVMEARRLKTKAVVLEIPLLFETGADKRCDAVICMTASRAVQQARVMKRPGMTAAKLSAILKRQMPDKEKRKRADFVVKTEEDVAVTRRRLRSVWQEVINSRQQG